MTSQEFEKEYAKLNPAQKEAVDAIEGPVMVIAGPGSGKTQILSLRVANILLKTDARPANILCLTFTESAAANMRKRLATMIGAEAYRVAIYTFHGFGTDLIGRHPEYFYGGARFAPADDLAQIEVVEEILKSLPFDNPLRKEHPEQGFTYLYDIRQSIGSLKKAGIAPDELKSTLEHNRLAMEKLNPALATAFDARLSAKSLGAVEAALDKAGKLDSSGFPLPHFPPYADALAASLGKALDEAKDSGATASLSKWKQSQLAKDDQGARVLKDFANLARLEAFADVYARYQERMYELGFFDFDDMLLEVIRELERNESLRSELQEEFQYVLVDEFQDTNDAQTRLLHLLLSAEVNEGRPNVMVVGDDDQAIYKFQGAQLSNILSFKSKYRNPKLVTLTHNYRSTQIILDIARFVIERGEERLENVVEEVKKDLVAANPGVKKGDVASKTFPTVAHEYRYVAKEIARLIKEGEEPKDIAVIARKHAFLEELVPFLAAEDVPVSYERQSDVLREPHVRQLVRIAKFVSTLMRKDKEEADHLLPEILSYPFWGVGRMDIWKVSVDADKRRALWLEAMQDSPSEKVRRIAEFLIGLAAEAKHQTAERVLDVIIGSHLAAAPESEDEDESWDDAPRIDSFVSPFREHYFGKEKLERGKSEYLVFLSSLRTFLGAVREYRKGLLIGVDDLVSFVDLHEKNGLSIPDTSPFVSSMNAVSLVTAHKAKGLEWKTVFVVNCENSVWAGRGPSRKISFPLNLPVTPAGDTTDDQLRLFYVALTRAKSNLYLTASQTTAEGRESLRLEFLLPSGEPGKYGPEVAGLLEFAEYEAAEGDSLGALAVAADPLRRNAVTHDEEALLRSLVADYQMSVTHLNNFLDVTKGGPMYFLEQNLVRFPQEKSLAAIFGTAMHGTIERVYTHLRSEGALPEWRDVALWIGYELKRERLSAADYELLLERGRKALKPYMEAKRDSFDPAHRIEVNFKNQGVALGDARLTGKIDKMARIAGDAWSVHDFKTGVPATEWEGKDQYEKAKLHRYEYQLIFYKLLVENSREFCDSCTVTRGCLEFIEPLNGRVVDLPLEMEEARVQRVRDLVCAVHKKICALEFPDVTGYDDDYSGILAFEEDLLEGNI